MILEAVAVKAAKDEEKAVQAAKIKQWQESRGKELEKQYG